MTSGSTLESSSVQQPGAHTVAARGRRWAEFLPGVVLGCVSFLWALREAGPDSLERFWDDALFFRRVAYNILHHGVAAWNVADGPVFINTSQVFQATAVATLALFPQHYNAAVVFLGAGCLTACWLLLWRTAGRGGLVSLAVFALLLSPPTFLAIPTGMETATALLVVSASIAVSLRGSRGSWWLPLAVTAQLFVFLTRPDATLPSLLTGVGVLVARREVRPALALASATMAGVALATLGFYLYYGTPLPLAAYLKVEQLSVYDSHYLSLGDGVKVSNLTQLFVSLLFSLPLALLHRDRVNFVLAGAGFAFVGYHGLTTNEIMGYHARFYAPALPFFFAAAARGVTRLVGLSWRGKVALLGAWVAAAAMTWVCFRSGWVETKLTGQALGYQYVAYAVGVGAVLVLSFFGPRIRHYLAAAVSVGLAGYLAVSIAPPRWQVRSDAESDRSVYSKNSGQVGLSTIANCFDEPLTILHSELGIPGVVLAESRVMDYTGLANPSVVDGTFDFEAICQSDRPEFIFRPHVTHRRLNRELNSSPCLRRRYSRAHLPRGSSCPLYVRKDLARKFAACQKQQLAMRTVR